MPDDSEFLRPALAVDEVGIAFGVFRRFRLRSMLQPVRQAGEDGYEARHLWLRPGVYLGRERVSGRTMADEACDTDRARLGEIGFAVDMVNGRNALEPGLGLMITADPEIDDASARDAWRWFEASRDAYPGGLVRIGRGGERSVDALAGLAGAIREAGFGLLVDAFGLGGPDFGAARSLKPDMVAFPGATVRETARVRHGAGLLRPLVSACHDIGATVLFGGIDGEAELDLALSCGADLVRGGLFDAWHRAGADLDLKPAQPAAGAGLARTAS